MNQDESKEFVRRVGEEAIANSAKALADAKAEAVKRGKEPFDLATLAAIADVSQNGALLDVQSQTHRYETMYYITFPELMTMKQLAARVKEINYWV